MGSLMSQNLTRSYGVRTYPGTKVDNQVRTTRNTNLGDHQRVGDVAGEGMDLPTWTKQVIAERR